MFRISVCSRWIAKSNGPLGGGYGYPPRAPKMRCACSRREPILIVGAFEPSRRSERLFMARKPMTSRERMLTALEMGIPDRLPVTIHQWQDYHLKTYMGGVSDLEAFRAVGLDAAITIWDANEEKRDGSIRCDM
jgi:hypothetical protein